MINPAELRGLRALDVAAREANRSMERLATGKKINRASDDPAGLTAAEALALDERRINEQIKRLQFEGSYIAARDGGSSVISDMLIEVRGLITQAANTGATTRGEREALQQQADALLRTFDHLSNTVTFNGQRILEGSTVQALGLSALFTGGELNLVDGDLKAADEAITSAIDRYSFSRAGLGNRAREIDSEIRLLQNELEQVMGIKSQILDTDYAAETSNLIRQQVLQQAATFTMQIARKSHADTVLQLLGAIRG